MKRLSPEKMNEAIWNMGTDLEAKGLIAEGGISQLQRFQAIAQAQLDEDRKDANAMYEALKEVWTYLAPKCHEQKVKEICDKVGQALAEADNESD